LAKLNRGIPRCTTSSVGKQNAPNQGGEGEGWRSCVRAPIFPPCVRACVDRLARAMVQAHAAGIPFDRAWSSALRGATHGAAVPRRSKRTRDAWKRAYHRVHLTANARRFQPAGERVLARLERETRDSLAERRIAELRRSLKQLA
jgi:hypothetical protein